MVGRIPGYRLIDFSTTFSLKKFKIKAGLNNITDKRYFTQRTDQYLGPGNILSAGRSFYAGIGVDL